MLYKYTGTGRAKCFKCGIKIEKFEIGLDWRSYQMSRKTCAKCVLILLSEAIDLAKQEKIEEQQKLEAKQNDCIR